jgi:hypothetical protein
VCRREPPRCAEEHETKECVALGKVVVCVNCRGLGIRNVLYERQVEVSRVRVVQKLSYAEAVKKVEEDGPRGRDPERSGESSRSVTVHRDPPTRYICFSKISFLVFILMVINCTAGIECKLQKIEVVVAAVERYLGVRDLKSEELQGVLMWWCPILPGCWPEVELNTF